MEIPKIMHSKYEVMFDTVCSPHSHAEFNKLLQQRQLLDGQLNENKNVLDELNMLDASNKVYKLFGPVLVKQELEESRQNVTKRMEYIKKELTRCHETLEGLEVKQDALRENLQKLQQQYQVAAAMK